MRIERGFGRYLVVQACSTATMMAYVASSPFLYQEILGFDGGQYGVLFAVNAAVAVVVNLVVNRGPRRLSQHGIAAAGFAVSLLGTARPRWRWRCGLGPKSSRRRCVCRCARSRRTVPTSSDSHSTASRSVWGRPPPCWASCNLLGRGDLARHGHRPTGTHVVPLASMAVTATVGMLMMLRGR